MYQQACAVRDWPVLTCGCCSNGRIDRVELKALLESVEGGLAYPLQLTQVSSALLALRVEVTWLVGDLARG
jgi:hypothetical protein